LLQNGTVTAWGGNEWGGTSVPAGLSNVIQIDCGYGFSVALQSNGTLTLWGSENNPRVFGGEDRGQKAVPTNLGTVVDVAAGPAHVLTTNTAGVVRAWGWVSETNGVIDGQTNVPPGLSGVVQVAAGFKHSVALKSDGTVVAWGLNDWGQTSVPSDLTDVFAISASGNHTLALRHVTWAGVPSITSISETSGVAGDLVAVEGTNFERVVAVRVAGRIVRWKVVSPTDMSIVLPSVSLQGRVEVETMSGRVRSSSVLTVLGP
jgi:alpha-tubulin suppressor-like RCC1 family protein